MDYKTVIGSLVTTAALAALYGTWRLMAWVYSVLVYRNTVSLTIQSTDFKTWSWLDHWMRQHCPRSIQHWRVKQGSVLEVATLPEPLLCSFEGHAIRVRINAYAPA